MIDPKHISILINLAIASLKVETITLPHMNLRPNIHILMYGRIGSTKSTILYDVAHRVKGAVIKGLTKANLYGIVDKEGEVMPPTIWDCANNFLFIDEYHLSSNDRFGKDLLNELLSVMEKPEYTKKISFKARDFKEKKGNLYCKIYKGRLEVKTKFSLFLNTMMPLKDRNFSEMVALKSRCICIPIFPSIFILEQISSGLHLYKYKDIKIKRKNVKISKLNYKKIQEYVKQAKVKEENYLRKIGDLCRVYAVLGKIDQDIFNLILSLP